MDGEEKGEGQEDGEEEGEGQEDGEEKGGRQETVYGWNCGSRTGRFSLEYRVSDREGWVTPL